MTGLELAFLVAGIWAVSAIISYQLIKRMEEPKDDE